MTRGTDLRATYLEKPSVSQEQRPEDPLDHKPPKAAPAWCKACGRHRGGNLKGDPGRCEMWASARSRTLSNMGVFPADGECDAHIEGGIG